MSNTDKVKFVRDGITREFKQVHIDLYSTDEQKWPESQGWVRVSEEVVDVMKLKEQANGGDPLTPAPPQEPTAPSQEPENKTGNAPAPKKSMDFKTTNEDLSEIRKHIANLSTSEMEDFFDGETRATILKIKEEQNG